MSIFTVIFRQDFNKPSLEVLKDLIYVHNQYQVSLAHTKFGKAKELDQRPDIEDDPNTYIPVKVDLAWDTRFSGSASGFMYRRLPLAAIVANPEYPVQALAFPFTTYDILGQINLQLGTQLTEDDLVNTTYTNRFGPFIIQTKPGSLLWVGFRDFEITGLGENPPLFGINTIDGFLSVDP